MRPELSQFSQRVSIWARLEPFTLTETDRYINHRLRVAGHKDGELFTAEARSHAGSLE